jgi:hypothetical protein
MIGRCLTDHRRGRRSATIFRALLFNGNPVPGNPMSKALCSNWIAMMHGLTAMRIRFGWMPGILTELPEPLATNHPTWQTATVLSDLRANLPLIEFHRPIILPCR